VGDATAHTLAEAARKALASLRSFVARRPGSELNAGSPA
jgi:hypothetical protein